MDFEDGEVRYIMPFGYKSSLDFEGVTVAPVLVDNTLYPAVQTLDRYLPGLMAIIHDGSSAIDAIDMVEKD